MTSVWRVNTPVVSGALDVLYSIVDYGGAIDESPVMQGQVLDWMAVQRDNGLRPGIVCSVNSMSRWRSVWHSTFSAAEVPMAAIEHQSLFLNLYGVAHELRRMVRQYGARHVYARSLWGSAAHALAFPVGGPPLIYDFRGDALEEARFMHGRRARDFLLKYLLAWGIKHADRFLGVSRGAAQRLETSYGCPDAMVIPSCVRFDDFVVEHAAVQLTRSELGLKEGDLLLVYAGGLAGYQMLPEMLALWFALLDVHRVHFLLLLGTQATMGRADITEWIGRFPQDRMTVKQIPRSDVARYLAAADVGFLLRQAHPLNTVASPVKFAEYLAAGLPVVTSPAIGDVSDFVAQQNVGAVIPADDLTAQVCQCVSLLEEVRTHRAAFRERVRAVGATQYDWHAHLVRWKEYLS